MLLSNLFVEEILFLYYTIQSTKSGKFQEIFSNIFKLYCIFMYWGGGRIDVIYQHFDILSINIRI